VQKEAEEKINNLRRQIDQVDKTIVTSLNERAKLVLSIKSLKSRQGVPIYDPKREEEIFEHLAKVNQGPLYDDDVREIYEKILQVMKALEE
jgi:chorismate mutase